MPEFKLHEAFSEPGAEEYKNKGNEAFKAQNWDEAIKNYNKAIQLDPKQASFYSNRAACWSSKGNHESALADSKKCLEADPDFVKGYSRKGKALFDLSRLDEAEAAYKEGLSKDSTNTGCLNGLADVKRARAEARKSSGSMFGGLGSMFGGSTGRGSAGAGGLGKKFMETMKKGGFGGRMQMYAVAMVAYFLYNSWTKGGSSPRKQQESTHDSAEDTQDESPVAPVSITPLRRGFAQVDGSWVSYVEAGARGDNLLLLLHRTPLSAEGEYGAAITSLLEKAASSPRSALRLLAPDRPCHGYSPCPPGKSRAGWLDALLAGRPKSKRLAIVASGRAAVRQALALARDRTQASRLLLLSPSAAGPNGGTLTEASDLRKWLEQQDGVLGTAAASADAARWAVASGADAESDDGEKLVVSGLPEGSRVVTMYVHGEKEDLDLKDELESHGLGTKVRRVAGTGDALLNALVAEAWRMSIGADDADEDEE